MPYPTKSPEGLNFSEIEETYKIMEGYFHNFYNDTVAKGKLVPIKSELVVGDKDYIKALVQAYRPTEREKIRINKIT